MLDNHTAAVQSLLGAAGLQAPLTKAESQCWAQLDAIAHDVANISLMVNAERLSILDGFDVGLEV
jgi:hypothetical protein